MFIKTIVRKYNAIKLAALDLEVCDADQRNLDQIRYDNQSNGYVQLQLDRIQTEMDEERDLITAALLVAVA